MTHPEVPHLPSPFPCLMVCPEALRAGSLALLAANSSCSQPKTARLQDGKAEPLQRSSPTRRQVMRFIKDSLSLLHRACFMQPIFTIMRSMFLTRALVLSIALPIRHYQPDMAHSVFRISTIRCM